MIILHQPPPPPGWGTPSISPFCLKLETYLRMAKLEYKTEPGNPYTAPKGKIPYVTVDGKKMGDSGLIIEYLKKTRGDSLDARLTDEQKALSILLQRLVEEHLYFCGAYLRWLDDNSFDHVRKYFLGILPPVIGPLLVKKMRKDFFKNMKAQGVARHTREEVLAMTRDDLAALSGILGSKDFFLGSEPASVDASLYGLLVQLMWVPWESEVTRAAKSHPNLEAYCKRMKERFWAGWTGPAA
jgi:glutathione S-transferase